MSAIRSGLVGAVGGAVLAIVAMRSCAPAPRPAAAGDLPAKATAELVAGKARLEEKRAAAAAEAADRIAEIEEAAAAEQAVPLVTWLNRRSEAAPRPAPARSPSPPASTPPTPVAAPGAAQACQGEGDGWIRCPASVLERIRIEVVDARAAAAELEVRLDLVKQERRLDGEAHALELGLYRDALGDAQADAGTAGWKVAGGIAGGAAVAAGIALAVAGHEEVGAALGVGGMVLAGIAVAF